MLCMLDTHLTWNLYLYPAPPLSGALLAFPAESCLQISCIETKGQDDQKNIYTSNGVKLHMKMQLVVIRNPYPGYGYVQWHVFRTSTSTEIKTHSNQRPPICGDTDMEIV